MSSSSSHGSSAFRTAGSYSPVLACCSYSVRCSFPLFKVFLFGFVTFVTYRSHGRLIWSGCEAPGVGVPSDLPLQEIGKEKETKIVKTTFLTCSRLTASSPPQTTPPRSRLLGWLLGASVAFPHAGGFVRPWTPCQSALRATHLHTPQSKVPGPLRLVWLEDGRASSLLNPP